MAYSFGGGVNAQLGAVDYSPFLRGSLHGSEMAGQGGVMQGQALAKAGQSIAQGVQQYYAKKEEKELTAHAVGVLKKQVANNPEIAKILGLDGESDDKAYTAAVKTIGPRGVVNLSMQLERFMADQKQQEAQAMAMQQQKAGEEWDQKAFNQAVAMSTDTDGKIDLKAVPGAFQELGGWNLQRFAPTMKVLQEISGEDAFKPEGGEIEVPGVGKIPFGYTSTGGVKYFDQQGEPRPPAAVQTTEHREKEIHEVIRLYREGKKDEAFVKALANDMKGRFAGDTVTMEYLEDMYGNKDAAPSPAPSTPIAFESVEAAQAANLPKGTKVIINGRTATKQ